MPIKNRDGTEYKIQGPNKIMKEQSFWDRDSVSLLNMSQWKEVVYKDQQVSPIKVLDEFMSRLSPNEVTFQQVKEKPVEVVPPSKSVEVAMPPVPKVEIEEVQEPLVSKDEKIAMRKQTYSCLPVYLKKKVDELYGDETVEHVYGQKFKFDGVPMDNNDLQMVFWTQKKLENGAIVFEQGVERHGRWWQVQKSEQDSGGYIVTTMISSINPDFSD